jgi:adenine-specific DNA-methyltransferase
MPLDDKVLKRYKNPDNDPRGPWQSVSANAQDGHGTPDQFYVLVAPNGKQHKLPKGRCWLYTERKMNEEIAKNKIWFGKNGNGAPRIKKFLSEVSRGLTPDTLWLAQDAGTNDEAKKETKALFERIGVNQLFDTPKPERLISRILAIATNPGDIVLDSFLGSGTTAAVAHKMGRRYIGVEMGEHAVTHCIPRLKAVIDGDQGGVSKQFGWSGGGGFRFYQLGRPVLNAYGIVDESVKFSELAALLWFLETGQGLPRKPRSPFIGEYNGTAYYLLFNGILGDQRPDGGNVLNLKTLRDLPVFDGPKVIYGECTRLGDQRLASSRIVFKQIPHDLAIAL